MHATLRLACVLFALTCSMAVLSSAATPENHRPAHRPRLSSRLMPSRTSTRSTPSPSPSPTPEATTASPSVTPEPEAERKEVIDISKQLLAQQHQQQVALDALKGSLTPTAASFAPAPFLQGNHQSQYQPATQQDIQQLLNLMHIHATGAQGFPTAFPYSTTQTTFAAGDSGAGFYTTSPYGLPDYSQYQQPQYAQPQYTQPQYQQAQYQQPQYQQSQFQAPQQLTHFSQADVQQLPYQLSQFGLPLPYPAPTTPTYVFHEGQYQIQTPSGQLIPIQLGQPAANDDSPAPSAAPQTAARTPSSSSSNSNTAEDDQPEAPQVGVRYVSAAAAPQQVNPGQNARVQAALLAQFQAQLVPSAAPQQAYLQQTQNGVQLVYAQPQQAGQQVQYVIPGASFYQQTGSAPTQTSAGPQNPPIKSTVARPVITLQARGGKFEKK